MISSAVSWASWRTCMLDVPSYFCYEKLRRSSLLKYWQQGRICWSVIGIETTGTFLAIAVEQMGEGNWFQLYIVSCETLLLLLPKQDLPFFFSVGIWKQNIIFSCLPFVATYLNWKLCNRNTYYCEFVLFCNNQNRMPVYLSSKDIIRIEVNFIKYKVRFVLVKMCISLTFQDTTSEYLRYNYLKLR